MRKNNAKTTYYWFGIFALCFLCFQAVSYYIRPNYSGEGAIISYFLGIAPNFFPAIGISALFLDAIEEFEQMAKPEKLYYRKPHFAKRITCMGVHSNKF